MRATDEPLHAHIVPNSLHTQQAGARGLERCCGCWGRRCWPRKSFCIRAIPRSSERLLWYAYAAVCSRMLTNAHVCFICSRMLMHAHVCSRMLYCRLLSIYLLFVRYALLRRDFFFFLFFQAAEYLPAIRDICAAEALRKCDIQVCRKSCSRRVCMCVCVCARARACVRVSIYIY